MGHIRLGRLRSTKRWDRVVDLLRAGSNIGSLAAATAQAAETELEAARGDATLAYAVWLLAQLPLAARTQQFTARLGELGFEGGAEQSVLRLVAGFSAAVDRNISDRANRTDFAELVRQAAAESLSSILGSATGSLFGSTSSQLQDELARLATRNGFAHLARDFFARITQKSLEYYLSRELANHVGTDRPIASIEQEILFRESLERHCREAALIVRDFAGGWYSKNNFRGTLNPDSAQAFADYALKKMRDELRARRAANG
jgi:hypothetical protein